MTGHGTSPQCFVAACTLPCKSSSCLPLGALRPIDVEEVPIMVAAMSEDQERSKSSADMVM